MIARNVALENHTIFNLLVSSTLKLARLILTISLSAHNSSLAMI